MDRTVTGVQNVSRMCMVCGRDNPWSLKARFYELEGGELLGLFQPLEEHQSYPGRLHGGIASAVLDETIGRADGAIARITKDSSRLFEGTGEIVLEDGTVAIEASGKYLKMPIDRIADGDFDAEWFVDERQAPGTI